MKTTQRLETLGSNRPQTEQENITLIQFGLILTVVLASSRARLNFFNFMYAADRLLKTKANERMRTRLDLEWTNQK
jgi:hypothetical protein